MVNSGSVNSVLEAAKAVNSPVIIQFSNGGAIFHAGKGCPAANKDVLGAIAGAYHVKAMSEAYGVAVILHTDHAARKRSDTSPKQRTLPAFKRIVARSEPHGGTGRGTNQCALGGLAHLFLARVRVQGLATRDHDCCADYDQCPDIHVLSPINAILAAILAQTP